jgi:hypothetical protein
MQHYPGRARFRMRHAGSGRGPLGLMQRDAAWPGSWLAILPEAWEPADLRTGAAAHSGFRPAGRPGR